jgi:hypothetical protein
MIAATPCRQPDGHTIQRCIHGRRRTFFSGGPGLTPLNARSTMNAVSFVSPLAEPGTGVRAKTV